jgi:cell division septation protein DedD
MDPIGPEESFRYIADRISRVGGVVDSLFTHDALQMIVKRANGYPARIDAICSASLAFAEGQGAANVDTQSVDSACAGASNPDSFEFEDGAPGEDGDTDGPSYFLADEHGEAAVLESDAAGDRTGRGAPGRRGASDNRRRMGVWALGLIGALGAVAALMTGGGPDDQLGGGAVGDGAQIAALLPDDDEAVEDRVVPAEPASVPKLTISKDGTAAPEVAAPVEADDEAQAGSKLKRQLEALKRDVKPSRATAPVHAAPRPAPAETVDGKEQANAERPRVQSPPYDATAPAAASAPATAEPTVPLRIAKAAPSEPEKETAPTKPSAPVVPVVPAPAAPKPGAEVSKPATRVASAAAPVPTGKFFTVQIGAFGSRKNAETLLSDVRAKYSDGRIMTITTDGKAVFRVVSGSFTDMGDAKARAAALDVAGFKTYVRSVEE